jgi:N-acetylmuramoyl-L-alanine amidase
VHKTPATDGKPEALFVRAVGRAAQIALLVAASGSGCDRQRDTRQPPATSSTSSTTGQTAAPAFSTAAPGVSSEPPAPTVAEGAEAEPPPPPAVAAVGGVRIQRLEHYAEERSARLVLHASGPVRFHGGHLASSAPGQRLYVDVDDAVHVGASKYELGGIVERVTLIDSERGVRVLMELSGPAEQNVFYLPAPFRVVIDVSRKAPAAAPVEGARRAVGRVALDPGHGGHDPGATGPSGIREKDVVLDIAHRAAPLIARELGASTLLTRDKDQFVPLEQRVAKANAFGADLFISIHCNADSSTVARGVMAFVLDGSENSAVRHVALRENLTPAAERVALRDPEHEGSGELTGFLEQFADTNAARASLVLARLLQRASQASLVQGYGGTPDGGVHGAGFYVLAGARMPAVLFETSFISNPIEEARLGTGRYRQKLADAIVNAVRAYRQGY